MTATIVNTIKNSFKEYTVLSKSIYILFLVRVVNSLGTLIFPFLTLFLTEKLMLNEKTAGMYVTIASTAFAPGAIIGGKLSDQIGRKKTYIIFQSAAGLCMAMCIFLKNSLLIPWILIFAALFVAGAQPANSAMIADITQKSNRKTGFSIIFLGNNLGIGLGGILAGFLFQNNTSLLFVICTIAMIITNILLALFVRETLPDINTSENSNNLSRQETDSKLSGEAIRNEYSEVDITEKSDVNKKESFFKVLIKKPVLLIFCVACVLFSLIYSQYNFSIPLQTKLLFGEKGAWVFGSIIMITNTLTIIILTFFVTAFSAKKKTLTNLILAGAFFAVGFGMIGMIKSILLLIISTVLWSIGEILYTTNSVVYIADNAPSTHRGRFNSFYTIISGSGHAIGPAVTGIVIDRSGIEIVWPVVFGLSILSMFFMYGISLFENRLRRVSKHN
ncbi:MAG: MFS transporter [Clostridiaceae bacterium]|nr:MFS transporter [Clostridiaceae bacterium]